MRRRAANAILLLLASGLTLQTVIEGAPGGLAWNAVFGPSVGALVALSWAAASLLTVVLNAGSNRRSAASIVVACAVANGLLAFPAFGVLTGMWVFAAWSSVAYLAVLTATGGA